MTGLWPANKALVALFACVPVWASLPGSAEAATDSGRPLTYCLAGAAAQAASMAAADQDQLSVAPARTELLSHVAVWPVTLALTSATVVATPPFRLAPKTSPPRA